MVHHVGVEGGVGRVRPRHGQTLPLVLHSAVLEPHLWNTNIQTGGVKYDPSYVCDETNNRFTAVFVRFVPTVPNGLTVREQWADLHGVYKTL